MQDSPAGQSPLTEHGVCEPPTPGLIQAPGVTLPQLGVPPGCGSVTPGACINPGVGGSQTPCSVNGDCPAGESCMGQLDCGGLYFGGSGVSVPVPSVVPDQSSSITTVSNCNATAG